MITTGEVPTWRSLAASASEALGDRLEAARIVCQAGGIRPDDLVRRNDEVVPPTVVERARALLVRRAAGEPLQWVLGTWGFRELEVVVDGRALVPRPETEIVVEHALVELRRLERPYEVVDLGTGSGVIALSIATEEPAATVLGTDASSRALSLAEENLRRQGEGLRERVRFASGDWFGAVPPRLAGELSLVVSNPPYLATAEWPRLEGVVRDYDPYEALVAGPTGLEAIGEIVRQSPRYLRPCGALVVEIAPHQAEPVLEMVASAGAFGSADVRDDLAGRPRVLVARALP